VKDECVFSSMWMVVAIVAVGTWIKDEEDPDGKSGVAHERLVSLYNIIGESLQSSKPQGAFAAEYYAPYFASLSKTGGNAR